MGDDHITTSSVECPVVHNGIDGMGEIWTTMKR